MQIDGIAASQAVDTSAERIDVKTLDISSLKARQGQFIYEHRHPDPKDKEKTPGTPHDLLGAITFAKKIEGPEDADDDRQLNYWNQVGLPFLYIRGELFDGDGHDAARAMAAVIRFYNRNDIPCVMRFSIDGHTLERDGQELKHCVARDIAITAKPCNHSCVSGVVSDPKAKVFGVDEIERNQENGLERMPGVEFTMLPFEADDVSKGEDIVAEWAALTEDLEKAIAAGSYNQAPGGMSQGAALQKETLGGSAVGGTAAASGTYATGGGGTDGPLIKSRLRAAVRDWDRRGPLRAHLEKTMRDVSPAFLQKFVDVLEDKVLSKAGELHKALAKAFLAKGIDEVMSKATEDPTKALGKPQVAAKPMTPTGTAILPGNQPKPKFQPMDDDDAIPQVNQGQIDAHMKTTQGMLAGRQTQPTAAPGSVSAPAPGFQGQVVENPHVPGIRVGLAPGEAQTKDNVAAAIRAQAAAMRTPAVAIKSETPDPAVAIEDLGKAAKSGAKSAPVKPAAAGPAPEAPLTIRGQPVQPNPGVRSAHFDESTGTLHTARGSFPMYIPSRDSEDARAAFHKILNQPKVNQFHNYAMSNWQKVHERLKAGKLPAAVIAHATLFSQLSPNTPVPMQEMMYGHLVDYMRAAGTNPEDPDFGSQKNFQGWMKRDRPDQYPQVSPEHWQRLDSQLRLKGGPEHVSEDTGRHGGQIKAFQLAENKWKNMARYHEIHDKLVGAVNKNKDDVRSTSRELMEEKLRGQGIPGLAPKTMRYTLGMLGGGNVTVPDTHFARHLFGLDRKLDAPTIDHIKQTLWRDTPAGSQTMEGIDRYYAKHHDAVKHLLEHPVHGKYFHDNPESAIFPAFWKHWVSIVPHEKMRGLTTSGHNEFTDHRVFWDAIQPFLSKSEGADDPTQALARRTAMLHARWVDEYGELPAMMMYYAYLVPHLMETPDAQLSPTGDKGPILPQGDVPQNTGVPQRVEQVQKAEQDVLPPPPTPALKVGGVPTQPGVLQYRQSQHPFSGAQLHIVGESPGHYVTLAPHDLHAAFAGQTSPAFIKVPKAGENKDYDVIAKHKVVTEAPVVNPDHVSYHSRDAADHLIGADLGGLKSKVPGAGSHYHHDSYFLPGPKGKIFVKRSTAAERGRNPQSSAVIETTFHNLAGSVFGLKDMVPQTATFHHPQTGQLHSAQAFVPGTHIEEDHDQLKEWHDRGLTPQMAVMDYVLGNNDRHNLNFIADPQGNPKLIDNGFAFHYGPKSYVMPDYVHSEDIRKPWGDDNKNWIRSLDPVKLQTEMKKNGLEKRTIDAAADRLTRLKDSLASPVPLSYYTLRSMTEPGAGKVAV